MDTVTVSSEWISRDSVIQEGIPIVFAGAENSRTPTCVE